MIISKIEKSKHKQERVLVYFEGGDLLKITEYELLQFGLYQGMDLSEDTVVQLRESGRKSETKLLAARMASSRMLSRKELQQKLEKRGASAEEADELAEKMEQLGAVDDRAYAGVIVRHYSAMHYGIGKIRQELFRHGIAKELWEEALKEMPDPAEGIDAFILGKTKGNPLTQDMSKKISNALLRRGYSWNDIREALNRMGQEINDD